VAAKTFARRGVPPPRHVVVVETRSQGAAAQQLWTALERNAERIGHFISISGGASILDEHLRWLFDRLKDRIPPNPTYEELDQMIRIEASRIYGEFRDRFQPTSPFPVEVIDPAARRFESDLEDKDELRASLECLPAETRELILSVFTATEDDVEKGRTRLAARLGLTRTALDQRLSRAYKRIRERMKGRRGAQKP